MWSHHRHALRYARQLSSSCWPTASRSQSRHVTGCPAHTHHGQHFPAVELLARAAQNINKHNTPTERPKIAQ